MFNYLISVVDTANEKVSEAKPKSLEQVAV